MSDGPLARYRVQVDEGALRPDPAQALAAEKLNSLHHALESYQPKSGRKGWIERFGLTGQYGAVEPPLGLYLYGGVGVGKSMLMELLADSLPERSLRVHFHEFMRDVHGEVHRLRQLPGSDDGDPIPGIADGIADSNTLLCLDEMEVRDIADAMIVSRIFARLFERGVVVVITSNRHPDALYKDGLQREKFLPFIELLKERLDLLQLEAQQDYRIGRILGDTVFHHPCGDAATTALNEAWDRLTDEAPPEPDSLQEGTHCAEDEAPLLPSEKSTELRQHDSFASTARKSVQIPFSSTPTFGVVGCCLRGWKSFFFLEGCFISPAKNWFWFVN